MNRLASSFFADDPVVCAERILGCELRFGTASGIIIETEAYRENGDEACHLFSRPSARAFARASSPGTSYVYLNYGIHWLLNVFCRDPETSESGFVLFRALDPVSGISGMQQRRGTTKPGNLCSGPGKLTRALGISSNEHGLDFGTDPSLALFDREVRPEVLVDRRVGISRDRERRWRFLAKGHPGISVPAGKA